ncbi:hypothetical protein SAY87_019855 [Trapa incisa]|uniref:Uncharacterized protein n=2 Tax=Trapa TaxID=22665 RepID=A0AAN7LVG8_TRANT|nr:hypothetical protein SAY87_019855 [Trapa incisa]KAK4793332.1 hypothetical protein SAY86_023767 [Trapa natans]
MFPCFLATILEHLCVNAILTNCNYYRTIWVNVEGPDDSLYIWTLIQNMLGEALYLLTLNLECINILLFFLDIHQKTSMIVDKLIFVVHSTQKCKKLEAKKKDC